MGVQKRDASPKPTPPSDTDATEGAAKADGKVEAVKFEPPPRPEGLRESLLQLYGLLALTILVFALIGQSMVHPVAEGKFEMKDGTIINVEDFDATDLGPYPKCHPHFEEHEAVAENGTKFWRKNSDAPKGNYPVGHPENPDWLKLSDQRAKVENAENRFKWKGLQPQLHLLVMATLVVILGSKHGVWCFTEPPETRQDAGQVLQSEDAYMFPILGSGVLFGLFVVLKYLGTAWIKTMITCWVVMICTLGIGKNSDDVIAIIRKKVMKPAFRIPYFDEDITLVEIAGCLVGACMAGTYVFTKNWIVNNIFGTSFCLLGIRMIGLNSIKVGGIMLVGLFFYDIFWVFGSKSVFGSNVMVSVATGVEAPIKLQFPRDLGGCGHLRHSMLGLGDIVVPGIFIAFLAKWDAVQIKEKAYDSFKYLNCVMVSYVLSLVTTVSIMLFFNAAQPALLYIVPYVLLTTLAVAIARGELKALWQFEIPDMSEDGKGSKDKTESEKKKN